MTWLAPVLLRPYHRQRYRLIGQEPRGLPRPHDGSFAHATGVNPDRVLLFGNGIAVGWGVASQELALPGQLARALSAETGRGADVEVLSDSGWDIESAAGALAGRDLAGYDAVVVVIGVSDAYRFLPSKRWADALTGLLDVFERETSATTTITLMGIQPVSSVPLFRRRPGDPTDRWAERLNRVSRRVLADRPRVKYLAPPAVDPKAGRSPGTGAEDPRYRSPRRFTEWALTQAAFLAPQLDAESGIDRPARRARNRPQRTERRLETIWDLGLMDSPREKRYDDIVRKAQQMFGTRGAAFSVLDDKRQWNKAVVGVEAREWPLDDSFCRTTIAHSLPFVVEDARSDDRAPKDTPMRFYAGYPVEAPDGTRIGALCVFDESPRPADSIDLVILRDLALAIQRELAAG